MRTTTAILGALSLGVLTACLGCGEEKKTMLFHAGVGQRSSLNEVREVFQKIHPEVDLNFSYKGSGYFIADIERSKEGDLYMPGEEFYLLQAAQRGYVLETGTVIMEDAADTLLHNPEIRKAYLGE